MDDQVGRLFQTPTRVHRFAAADASNGDLMPLGIDEPGKLLGDRLLYRRRLSFSKTSLRFASGQVQVDAAKAKRVCLRLAPIDVPQQVVGVLWLHSGL